MGTSKRALTSSKGIAGLICIAMGIFFAAAYDSKDYAQINRYQIADPMEQVAAMRENDERERLQKGHVVLIGGSFVFGVLLLLNSFWRAKQGIGEDSDLEEAANAIKAESLLDEVDEMLDD